MIYLPVASQEDGNSLGLALWTAHRPNRQPSEITTKYAGTVQAVSNQWYVEIDDGYEDVAFSGALTEEQISSIVDAIEKAEDAL